MLMQLPKYAIKRRTCAPILCLFTRCLSGLYHMYLCIINERNHNILDRMQGPIDVLRGDIPLFSYCFGKSMLDYKWLVGFRVENPITLYLVGFDIVVGL